ncbi:NCS2 family permease [Weissella diestrammenae]|uniref:NCS2 family permease n=1 Tax=Weissella diestrammenae TaxID=1162633 RepID=UPI001FAE6783|nr:NCS2 family permease [Weissella diestrammenae]
MAMAYIVFLNPAVLSLTGMPSQGVFLATIFTAVVGTLITGLFANLPYALAPSIGMQAMFTYTIVFGLGFTWQQALGMVFLVGVVDIIITLTKLRSAIVKGIPEQLKHAIAAGIGLFIAYIGLKNAGFLNFIVDPANITKLNGAPFHVGQGAKTISSILANGGTTPEIANFNQPALLLALIGLIILVVLVVLNVPGAFLISVGVTTLIGIPMGVTNTHMDVMASFQKTFHEFGQVFGAGLGRDGLWSMFTTPKHILVVILTVFSMGLSGLFDAIGTFIGTGMTTGIFSEKDQREFYEGRGFKSKMDRGLVADTFATMMAGVFGTSNTTTFIESASGIKAGGRTGLTSVVIAAGFLLAIFAAPLVGVIPTAATAPILIIVGIMMMNEFKMIDWNDIEIAIPAFFTSAFMAFSYSISYGIAAGFIFFIVVKVVRRKWRQISPILWVVSLLFLLNFISLAVNN